MGNLKKLTLSFIMQIPALVSLKKLPSVSFAGVDSLDDVKNHTYNELFVSGGFMVSDEFVLNPDLITQGKSCFSLCGLYKVQTNITRLMLVLRVELVLCVLSRSFAGTAEVPGGTEHP